MKSDLVRDTVLAAVAVILAVVFGFVIVAFSQEKKESPIPKEGVNVVEPTAPKTIPIEFQNKILKLQLHQQQIAAEYQGCSNRMAQIPQEFNTDNAKIGQESDAALKEMKLDLEHWTVDVKGMVAIPKPVPQAEPPKAKAEEKKP